MKIVVADKTVLDATEPINLTINKEDKPIIYNTEDETLKIVDFNDVKSEILTKFMNRCLTEFEQQEKYYLMQSESDISDDMLRMDMVNRKDCYSYCKMLIKIIREEFLNAINNDKYC